MGKNRKSTSTSNAPPNRYTEEEWESVKSIKDIENLTGYKIIKDKEGNLTITDSEYDTTIIIDKYYTKGGGKRAINMKNDGTQADDVGEGTKHPDLATYDLKEVVRIYNEAPDSLKKANGLIVFKKDKLDNDTVGEHIARGSDHAVIINPSAFGGKNGSFNLSKELYHEMAHGYDYHHNYKFKNGNVENYGLSIGNKKFQELVKNPITDYTTWYIKGTPEYYQESLADAIGIVATYNNGNHDFTVDVPHKGNVPVKEWMKDNKELVKETNNIINGNFKTISVDDYDNMDDYDAAEGYIHRWLSNPDNIQGVQEKGEIIW